MVCHKIIRLRIGSLPSFFVAGMPGRKYLQFLADFFSPLSYDAVLRVLFFIFDSQRGGGHIKNEEISRFLTWSRNLTPLVFFFSFSFQFATVFE